MTKRVTALVFILLASIILLANAVVPHHHHENEICFIDFHCQSDNDNHHDCIAEHKYEHDAKSKHEHNSESKSEYCVLNQVFVVPSNQTEQKCIYSDCTDNHPLFNEFQAVIFDNDFYNPFLTVLSNSQLLLFSSSYSYFAGTIVGLRAPPIV